MKVSKIFLLLVFSQLFISCSSLVLQPADFSWPIESVVKVDDDGFAAVERYSISFNARGLFFEELQDSSLYLDKELRVIRDTKGFYFVTSKNFKNVYLFNADDGKMKLEKKILVSENGISNPAFNQRLPYIELIDGNKKVYLSNKGIKDDEK